MEIAIMRQIDHPNVVKLYEIKKTDKHMYLVLEYCAGGDLQQFMRRQQPKEQQKDSRSCLPEAVARHFLRELATGMQCLWLHNLIHRDLKPQNLLLVEDSPTSALKIADFGFARHLATASMAETLCGSPLYMAPEILKFQKYDAKADLWSVGTILFEMVAGRPPFGGANHVQLLANIERQPLHFPSTLQLSRSCRHLLVALLQRKPALRLGFAEFFADPFVDLQPLTEELDLAVAKQPLSTISANASIREEEEDSKHELSGRWGISAARAGSREDLNVSNAVVPPESSGGPNDNDQRCHEPPVSNKVGSSSRFASTAPPTMTRQSRSGNLEVMETAFASASSGSGALRRSSSSRLARSRRASSSGSGFVAGTSPKLSPQMSPHILPSPSPRINPFKRLSESPPGVAALPQLPCSASGSYPVDTPPVSCPANSNAIVTAKQKSVGGGCGHTFDSSGEYVLVDGVAEKIVAGGQGPRPFVPRTDEAVNALPIKIDLATRALPIAGPRGANAGSLSRECGQQLFDVVALRTQAIALIADQLWALSTAGKAPLDSTNDTIDEPVGGDWSPQQTICKSKPLSISRGKRASRGDFSSIFSMSMSLSSSVEVNNVPVEDEDVDDDEDEDERRSAERRYMCAAEALALYVKCLRLLQHVVLYLRHDPAFDTSRDMTSSRGSIGTSSEQSGGASQKASMIFLSGQLTHYLSRAEQCKAQMNSAARFRAPTRIVASQEELLYTHAVRIGRQGAIREVLGHTRAAHDHYLQALLLLESLMMDTSSEKIGELGVDDQKNVNDVLLALEMRLKNVRTILKKEEGSDLSSSHQRNMQGASRPQH
uniref:Protein kinase domain-containing protein n=1 Tax=Hyaloperonospora arabidopsidis (strain Emoy2) TaxID=559515 RepID=M4C0F3_HYAAE